MNEIPAYRIPFLLITTHHIFTTSTDKMSAMVSDSEIGEKASVSLAVKHPKLVSVTVLSFELIGATFA